MPRKSTIGNNPLDTLIPASSPAASASRRNDREDQVVETPRMVKERLTVHLPIDVIERVKNVVYWTPGLTLAGFAEEAFAKAVEAMEKKRGEAYPPRKENLKGGRPMK
jgi:hypothetical protein